MPTTGEIHKFINRIKDDFTDNLDPKNRTEEERDWLVGLGWKDEGTAWYAVN